MPTTEPALNGRTVCAPWKGMPARRIVAAMLVALVPSALITTPTAHAERFVGSVAGTYAENVDIALSPDGLTLYSAVNGPSGPLIAKVDTSSNAVVSVGVLSR